MQYSTAMGEHGLKVWAKGMSKKKPLKKGLTSSGTALHHVEVKGCCSKPLPTNSKCKMIKTK
jgi:hypothetical protein